MSLQNIIETAFDNRANFGANDCPADVRSAVEDVLAGLDNGTLRVAEKVDGEWVVHQWIKKAVLLSFKINDNKPIESCDLRFFDKVETKFTGWSEEDFKNAGVRVVPPAVARKGSFIAKNVVLMPSYTNIGAYVDEGTMVDTWATVGSCAQIGKNVHLSGGVGIGGALVGGLLGSQIGGGSGSAIASSLGATAGGVLGENAVTTRREEQTLMVYVNAQTGVVVDYRFTEDKSRSQSWGVGSGVAPL